LFGYCSEGVLWAQRSTRVACFALFPWSCYYDYIIPAPGGDAVKEMAAGKFKAQCLAIMDQVLHSGEPVLITKHGKPVAKLVPAEKQADDIFGYMTGKVKIVGDIVGSGTPLEAWECK
jgi:prevent-host-death family protein